MKARANKTGVTKLIFFTLIFVENWLQYNLTMHDFSVWLITGSISEYIFMNIGSILKFYKYLLVIYLILMDAPLVYKGGRGRSLHIHFLFENAWLFQWGWCNSFPVKQSKTFPNLI